MIKFENTEVTKISAKGKLMSIDENGISILDLKENTLDVITFENVRKLIGKEITIAIQNKEEV